MELTSEKSCCSAGNNQVDEQAGITQHRWQLSRRWQAGIVQLSWKLSSRWADSNHAAQHDSVRPHRWQPTRMPSPWDCPGKNTGVGCHYLLQCMKVKRESEVTQSCLTLSDPMDCSPPGSSVHGIFQAPPSMGFSRQEYWSGVPLPSPTDNL